MFIGHCLPFADMPEPGRSKLLYGQLKIRTNWTDAINQKIRINV